MGEAGTASEVEDEAGGDARLVLGAVVEASEQVVDLDGANPEVRNDFQVDASADGGGERVNRVGKDLIGAHTGRAAIDDTRGDGLMRTAEEQVGKGRDAGGKRDLRTGKASVLVDVAGGVIERGAVVCAEIRGDAEEGKEAIRGGSLKAIEVLPVGDRKRWLYDQWAEHSGADKKFICGDRGTEIGITAEDDEMVLRRKRGRNEEKTDEK